MPRWFSRLLLVSLLIPCLAAWGQETQTTGSRKVTSRTLPAYPSVARGMHLGGIVKVEAVVAPNGTVKTVSIRGGAPILAGAAADAVRKWKWAPAARETREPVEVKFSPYE